MILAAARKLLNEKNLYPTAITIPIFEESKRTSGGHTQITYRIKILHIKEIQYDGKKITTYIADYYDSKREYLKSHRSDTFRKAVSAALDTDAKGSWTDITNQSNERFQPHLNASDDGYWTFLWCYQLFDKGKIDFFNQDYLTEHQMKLLFINFNLNNYKRVKNNNGNYQSLIDKMEILYLEILSENKVYIPALEILYDITKQIKKYQKQQNNKDQDSFYQKQKERIDAFYAISKSQNSIATTPPLLHNSNDDDEIYEYDDDLKRYSSVKIFLSGFQSEEQYSFLTEGGNVSASTDNSQTTLNGHRNSTGLSNSRPNTTAIGNSNDDLNPLTSLPSFHAERYEDKLFVNQSSSFTAPQWAITVKNFCYKNRRSIAGALLFLFGLYVITLTLVSAFTGGATLPLLGYTLAVADKFVAPLWAVATVSTVAGLGGGGSMLGGWFLHKSNPSINGDSGDAPAATPVLSNK